MARALPQQHPFRWHGTDRKGARLKGQSRAPNASMMKAMLRKQGINPLRVRKQSNLFGLAGRHNNSVKAADIAIFARQLATMIAAGVPLVQALDIIAKAAEKPALAGLLGAVKNNIEDGATLAEALSKHPKHFDDLFVNLVDAGEKSGALDGLLHKVAIYKEKTEAIKAKVRKAMFYPCAVVVVAIIVMGIMLCFVVPRFQALFQGFGAQLPSFTLFVIALSEFVQGWWGLLLAAAGAGTFIFLRARKRFRKFRRLLDRIAVTLPVVGNIFYKAVVARFARTLSTMFAAGVPLVEAMGSVAKASGNIVFEEAILQMREQVSTGQRLQLTMSNTGLFPSMAVQMVAIGEESGALDSMCAKVADFYEAEVDNRVDALSSLLEPLIMVVIGVLVGGLVVAMYLPIFKLGSVI